MMGKGAWFELPAWNVSASEKFRGKLLGWQFTDFLDFGDTLRIIISA